MEVHIQRARGLLSLLPGMRGVTNHRPPYVIRTGLKVQATNNLPGEGIVYLQPYNVLTDPYQSLPIPLTGLFSVQISAKMSNASGSDDEDLKRAIALSLGQQDPAQSSPREVIDLESDEEEKDTQKQANATPHASGILGLDRAQMEAERLARKRKATSPAPAPRIAKVEKPSMASDSGNMIHYAGGIVKKTWVKGQPRMGDDITLREVLQPETLRLAVLSSFQWDIEWVFSYLRSDTKKVSSICNTNPLFEDHYLSLETHIGRVFFLSPSSTIPYSCPTSLTFIPILGPGNASKRGRNARTIPQRHRK